MAVMEMDGVLFRNLCKGGLKAILNEEKRINGLNVFPVPDGDTGTNMKLTLEHGVKDSTDVESIGAFGKALARGMLLGARGNSGVILSQIFKGISKYLKAYDKVNAYQFKDALIKGYETAYSAVIHPVEGTILTVCRLGIENIKEDINEKSGFEDLFHLYIASMKDVLKKTPEMLPVLKDAGVIDSGGAGLIVIFEGMERILLGEEIPDLLLDEDIALVEIEEKIDYGYSVEFNLDLAPEKEEFKKDEFISFLEKNGNSVSLILEGNLVKVNLLSQTPGEILNEAQKYGEFIDVKIDTASGNKKEQKKKMPHKHLAYIAVAQGSGFIDLFKDFGCDIVLDGGKTMNTSSEEFLNAMEVLDADDIIILPNNKNIQLAAEQAAKIKDSYHVHVLPTQSLVEGYFAFSMMDTVDEQIPAGQQIENMKSGMKSSHTFGVTMAVKDSVYKNIHIKRGDYISLLDGDIILASKTKQDAVIEGLKKVKDMEKKEILILFKGKNLDEDEADEILEMLQDRYFDAQCGIIEGEQDTYGVLIGIS